MAGAMASSSFIQLVAPKFRAAPARTSSRTQMQVPSSKLEEAADHFSSRRQAIVACSSAILVAGIEMVAMSPQAALADFLDDYKSDTQAVIAKVKETLALEKTDPSKSNAVATLRQSSNSWVAKYRREKSVAGKPSFSNMYSVLNAISGHYISFGPSSPIPAKRQQRILEEVSDAEKALSRGR